MTFRYIGSKSRLVDQILALIGPHRRSDGFFVDAFCGTGVVAEAAASLGWPIRLNDSLYSAVISARARLVSTDEGRFHQLGGYAAAIQKLNQLKPHEGYIWRTYSPASLDECGIERRYFTERNAAKIDSMRKKIAKWKSNGMLSEAEEHLLIGDLFSALNRVANIAGTFGCFLSKWTPQSLRDIEVRCRDLKSTTTVVETSVGDVFDVRTTKKDLVYLDPPYTKRQYASYYHILETVAYNDQPAVEGVAGLRPWRDKASAFCYKSRALKTLSDLVSSLNSSRVLLSYSSEGHICTTDLREALEKLGEATMHPLGEIGRYRPNETASNNSAEVSEYLIEVSLSKRKKPKKPTSPEALERA